MVALTTVKAQAASYYVDSSAGNDSNSCQQAQNQATPRRTVNGVNGCGLTAGDTVYFRGTFDQTLTPNASGQVLLATTNIARVSGSVVEFNSAPPATSATSDFVYVYGSRKGNSGAFKVISSSGNQVTVDTSNLPGGAFVTETATEPGDLQAAVVRPLHFTAWDKNNPPTWNLNSAMYYGFNRPAVMLSYLRSMSGANNEVWGAVYLDGGNSGSNDYFVMDHVEIQNAATAVGLSNNDFQANYGILQHNHFHNVGYNGGVSDEIIYWGNFLQNQKHHDFVQMMYNRIGPQKRFNVSNTSGAQAVGDGIEIKASSHNPTVWGNIITGIHLTTGCDDSPIRSAGSNGFIANNYISDVYPQPENIPGCGISIVEGAAGAQGTIVANNVIANVKSVGIRVFNTSNVQILNNTIYNIRSIQGCCAEESAGIQVHTYGAAATNVVVRNNIVHTAPVGIGRYPWDLNGSFSMSLGNNIVFNAGTPWGVGATQTSTDRVADPGLVNPAGGNFSLSANSTAIGAGADLSSVFTVDNHNAANPTQQTAVPVTRSGSWEIGAYDAGGTGGGVTPVPSPSVVPVTPTPSPSVQPTPSPSAECLAADLNRDGVVNTADRTLLIADFFKRLPSLAAADINADGIVDVTDYGLLVRVFGQSCQ